MRTQNILLNYNHTDEYLENNLRHSPQHLNSEENKDDRSDSKTIIEIYQGQHGRNILYSNPKRHSLADSRKRKWKLSNFISQGKYESS